jgi:aryl-alcohol dehydrogenase-like predicted oxidoreductase
LKSNKLIVGTVQFGLNYGVNNNIGKPNKESVFEILKQAHEKGIRILDSAEAYGDSHQIIGEFHRLFPNHQFDIITKLPHEFDSSIEDKVIRYISELNVPELHSLLFHSFDSYKINSFSMNLLNDLKSRELINSIGVSVYSNEQLDEVILDDLVDVVQLPYNLFDNDIQRGELLEKAKSKNKIVHTRSAFLQGLFFTSVNAEHHIAKMLSKELNFIRDLAIRYNVSLPSLALNYCLAQDNIDNVLIGVDTLEQLNQNIKFSGELLDPQLIKEINTINIENTNLLNPSLWEKLKQY